MCCVLFLIDCFQAFCTRPLMDFPFTNTLPQQWRPLHNRWARNSISHLLNAPAFALIAWIWLKRGALQIHQQHPDDPSISYRECVP